MKAKAYLVMFVDTLSAIPTVSRVGIFSSPAGSLTTNFKYLPVDILSEIGETYGEAKDKLLALCENHPLYKWVLPWVRQPQTSSADVDEWMNG